MVLLELKYDRLSEPERFLLDIFDGLVEYICDQYPDIIFYKKDNMAMFKYDSKKQELWYSYHDIRVVFREKFKLNLQETNEMVQSMVETILKLIVKTTQSFHIFDTGRLHEN